jgi:hypothetical protein
VVDLEGFGIEPLSKMSTASVPTLPVDLPDDGSQESQTEKFTVVSFDGNDDQWDPKNYPKWKKWGILFSVAHGAVIVTCTSSLYVSIFPEELKTDG